MKKAIIPLVVLFCHVTFSQESDPILTDRPTQSAAVYTVGEGNLLIESGFFFENTNAFQQFLNFNSLFRYGISDKVEIRLTGNFDRVEGDDFVVSGIGSTSLGTKVFLTGSDKAFADISAIAQINLPTGEGSDETTGEIRFNFQNQLSSMLSLGYNLGLLISPDQESKASPFYSIVLGATVADGWTVFAEPYGFLNEPADHRFNAGVIYLLSPGFQLDFSGGVGLSDVSPSSFVSFGAAIGF